MNGATTTVRHAQRRFRAMGSDAHVIVTGDAAHELLTAAIARIDHLERCWSRFRDDSDVSELNRHPGMRRRVHPDTATMIERSIDLWRITGGAVDPLLLGAVVRAGYDRSFDTIGTDAGDPLNAGSVVCRTDDRLDTGDAVPPQPADAWFPTACTDVVVERGDGGTFAMLPDCTGFDPGGIGKGLAADLVVGELLAAGASGACVNLGGDLRVAGASPRGSSWSVGIEHPCRPIDIVTLDLATGAAATSSTLRRVWRAGAEPRHHLIDSATGRPSATDVVQATVVARDAWIAEGLAKAVLLRGTERSFDVLPAGIEALTIDCSGVVRTTPGLSRFAGHRRVPAFVDLNPDGSS